MRTATLLAGVMTTVAMLAGCADGQVQRKDSGDQAGYVSGVGVTTIAPD